MKNLQSLITEYKETKSEKLFLEIFSILEPLLNKKAKHIFFKKKFVKDRFTKEEWNEKKKQFEEKEMVKCVTLVQTKKWDLEDVISDLKIFIFELIERYDPTKPFQKYLYTSIYDWQPSFTKTIDFVTDLHTIPANHFANKEGDSFFDTMATTEPDINTIDDINNCFKNLTKRELEILELLKEKPTLKQTELADILGLTKQRIEQILKSLRKKYKKPLDF